MALTIRYFARLREAVGRSVEQVAFDPAWQTVAAVRDALAARGECWGSLLAPDLQCARNGELVGWESLIADGDEIAFFPPVTGG